MTEKAGNFKEYLKHFELHEANLRKFHQIFEEYSKKLEVEAHITFYVAKDDDSFYETSDIEKVLGDENSTGKTIRSLSIELIKSPTDESDKTTEKERRVAVISFSSQKEEKIMIFTSHDSRDWCYLLTDELDTQVQRILKSKSYRLQKVEILDYLLSFIFIFSPTIFIDAKSEIDSTTITSKTTDEKVNFLIEQVVAFTNFSLSNIVLFTILFIIMFVFIIEYKPLSKLITSFNRSVYYWGDMISVHDQFVQRRTRYQWGIGIAFVVSAAASIFVSPIILNA